MNEWKCHGGSAVMLGIQGAVEKVEMWFMSIDGEITCIRYKNYRFLTWSR